MARFQLSSFDLSHVCTAFWKCYKFMTSVSSSFVAERTEMFYRTELFPTLETGLIKIPPNSIKVYFCSTNAGNSKPPNMKLRGRNISDYRLAYLHWWKRIWLSPHQRGQGSSSRLSLCCRCLYHVGTVI